MSKYSDTKLIQDLKGIELNLHILPDGRRFGLSDVRSAVCYGPRELSSPTKAAKANSQDDYFDVTMPFCGGEKDGPIPFC